MKTTNRRFIGFRDKKSPFEFAGLGAGTAAMVAAVSLVLSLPLAGQKVEVPIETGLRKPEALPAGDKIDLTLNRAIELALRNALDLDVSMLSYEYSRLGIGIAEGAFDSSLGANLGASRTKSAVVSGFDSSDSKSQNLNFNYTMPFQWGGGAQIGLTNVRRDSVVQGFTLVNPTLSTGLTASFTQPLMRNFGKDINTRLIVQARLARDSSAFDFQKTVQTAVQTVENAYWDLVNARANLKAKLEALDRAKDFNRITKIKIDVGALAPIDIVQTEVAVAQREQDIINAESLIGDAEDRLKRILNVSGTIDWKKPIIPIDEPAAVPITVDLEKSIQHALAIRPEVKQAILGIESKKINLAYNRNQLKPRLDLSGTYGLSGVGASQTLQQCSIPGVSVDECITKGGTILTTDLNYSDAYQQIWHADYPNWTVGLTFSIPIGNRVAKGNVAQARTDLELSRTNLALLRQNIQLEVRAAQRGIDTGYKSVVAARKSRELAEKNLEAEQKKYENGMTTSFQVAQIQNDLTSAQSGEILALSQYLKAVTAWHKAVGDILDVKSIELTGLPVNLGPVTGEEGQAK